MTDASAPSSAPVKNGRPFRNVGPRLPLEMTIMLLLTSITLLVLGMIGAHLIAHRNEVLETAEKNAANLASAFEEHLSVSIGLLDDTLLAARGQDFVRHSDQLRQGLKVRPGLNNIALQVSVADRTGAMISSNFDISQPITIADRPHFRHFSESDADDLYISVPVLGRVSNRWTIQFVRRLPDVAGQFDGIIVASLPPDYLIRFYHTIDVGTDGLVTVAGLDGIIRAQTIREKASYGQPLGNDALIQAVRATPRGTLRDGGSVDGVRRLIAYKRVRNYPLFVAVGLAEQDVLADFRHEVWLWGMIALAGVLFLTIAGVLTLRQVSAQRAYENRIADHQRELEIQVAQRTERLSREIERRTQSEEALKDSITALKTAQSETLQASRMASVGQLAAGIAHEINTPVQYIGDNLRFIGASIDDLLAAGDAKTQDQPEKLAFLRSELPSAVTESLDGVAQIARIVLSMKDFSHPGTEAKALTDLNQSLDNTLTVSHNGWKHVATVERKFSPDLPPVLCLPGEMNQVFLNLIMNAAQAIETSGKPLPGRITVETTHDADWATIKISDTGSGVPEAIRERVFDLFFTTKPVGKGTGQGLAICRDVVMAKHGGTIAVGGEEGEGAVFTIRIPIDGIVAPALHKT